MSVPSVLDLSGAAAAPAWLVGGKGANLARLAALGLPVPPGVAVTTRAFERYLRHHGVPASAWGGDEAARAFGSGRWPEALRAEVEAALRRVPGEALAVRSSATCEDGARWSLAGQFQSFLFVPRAEALAQVARCWASLAAPAARAYLAMVHAGEVRMAVVVQAQVSPAWSGVAFSLDPVGGSLDELVVEWTEGTGERLMLGEVTPRRVRLRRHGDAVPSEVPAGLARHLPALRSHLLAVERAFGRPVDVEWCATPASLLLLQARPVTPPAGAPQVPWSSVNLAENFPGPLTALEWSFLHAFYRCYVRAALRLVGCGEGELAAAEPLTGALTGVHRGRIHYDLASWHALLGALPCGGDLPAFFDGYVGQEAAAPPPDAGGGWPPARLKGPAGALRLWSRLILALLRTGPRLARLEARLEAERPGWRRRLGEASDPREVERLAGGLLELLERSWRGPCAADLAVMILPGLLGRLLPRWCGAAGAEALPALLQGVAVASGEPSRALWRLAQDLAPDEPARRALLAQDYPAWWAGLAAGPRARFQSFLSRFGGRCWSDCALASPTFEERPDLAFRILQQLAGRPEAASPARLQAVEAVREERLRALCRPLGWPRGAALRGLVRLCHRAIQHRERGRLAQGALFGEARRAFLRLGELLEASGALPPGGLFHLTWEELRDLSRGALAYPECLPGLVAARRAAHAAAAGASLPTTFLLGAGAVVPPGRAPPPPSAAGRGLLQGLAVSRGRARGRARVVRDPGAQGLAPGEVLVAPSADPGWTPLLLVAGALVLERGGLLSHGAVVAREAGLPAVVQIEDACRAIPEGALVEVDGDAGTVRIEPADG